MQIILDEYLRDPLKQTPEIELVLNQSKIVTNKILISISTTSGHKEIISGYFKNRSDIEKLRNYLDSLLRSGEIW